MLFKVTEAGASAIVLDVGVGSAVGEGVGTGVFVGPGDEVGKWVGRGEGAPLGVGVGVAVFCGDGEMVTRGGVGALHPPAPHADSTAANGKAKYARRKRMAATNRRVRRQKPRFCNTLLVGAWDSINGGLRAY